MDHGSFDGPETGESSTGGIVMRRLNIVPIVGVLLVAVFAVPAHAGEQKGCLVKMIDNFNEGIFLPHVVFLESRSEKLPGGQVKYSITSDFASQTPWNVEVTVPTNSHAPIMTDVGVPVLTIGEIREDYLFGGLLHMDGAFLMKNGYVKQDAQLMWVIESDRSSCSADDLALVVFLVHEWFFFG
jgi:hypothetical protein